MNTQTTVDIEDFPPDDDKGQDSHGQSGNNQGRLCQSDNDQGRHGQSDNSQDRDCQLIRLAMVRADRSGVLDSHPVMVSATKVMRKYLSDRRKRRQIQVVLSALLSDANSIKNNNHNHNHSNNNDNNNNNNSQWHGSGTSLLIDTLTQTLADALSLGMTGETIDQAQRVLTHLQQELASCSAVQSLNANNEQPLAEARACREIDRALMVAMKQATSSPSPSPSSPAASSLSNPSAASFSQINLLIKTATIAAVNSPTIVQARARVKEYHAAEDKRRIETLLQDAIKLSRRGNGGSFNYRSEQLPSPHRHQDHHHHHQDRSADIAVIHRVIKRATDMVYHLFSRFSLCHLYYTSNIYHSVHDANRPIS